MWFYFLWFSKVTRSMKKIIDIMDPKNKVTFVQLQREPRRVTHRRRHSTPLLHSPTDPVRQRLQHRAMTLGAPVLYCYCNMPDDGSLMVRCTKRACTVKWFHVKCIEKNVDLRGKWFCRSCRSWFISFFC